MAERIGRGKHRDHIPGIHRALGDHARTVSRQPDARIKLMTPHELADMLASNSSYAQQVKILRLDGDPDWVRDVEETAAVLRQELSDAQPRARSLDALAELVDGGHAVTVQPTQVLDVLADRRGIRTPCRVGDYGQLDAPEWLVDLTTPVVPVERWPAATVTADDWVAAV